ncbi:Acryloyl-CoA reductase (NADH) [compost metagenome]
MNFDFSDDQNVLREEVRKFLVNKSPLGEARQVMDTGLGHSAAVWQGLCEMGVTTLMLPENCGGHGLGALELCVVAEEVGRQLAPVPLVSTMYLAVQAILLAANAAQQQAWLPRIADGQVATLAAPLSSSHADAAALPRFDGKALHGVAPLVVDGEAAALAVVLAQGDDDRQVLVLAESGRGVSRRRLASIDPTRGFAQLQFDATPAEALDGDARAVLTQVRDRAAILLAFEQLGGADSALAMGAAYARERKAFGRAIGSYQGIKHKLADIYTRNEMARAHCYYGAWALSSDAPELAAAAAAARIAATDAFSYAAQENLQTHGGMGYTWEMDCHLYYRRARQLAVVLGSRHEWSERLVCELEARLSA